MEFPIWRSNLERNELIVYNNVHYWRKGHRGLELILSVVCFVLKSEDDSMSLWSLQLLSSPAHYWYFVKTSTYFVLMVLLWSDNDTLFLTREKITTNPLKWSSVLVLASTGQIEINLNISFLVDKLQNYNE